MATNPGELTMTSENKYEAGRFLYCIINNSKETDFGHIGIEDNQVYTIVFNDIGVIVHRCKAKPYQTEDKEKVADWILTHQYVIDLATKEFGTVIPLTFDTIFKGDDKTVTNWISEEYHDLKALLLKLEGKSEYGIQIFFKNEFINKMITESNEIQILNRELENKSSGAAYLFKKKVEKRIQIEKKASINKYATELYSQIKTLVDNLKLESTKRKVPEQWKDKQMILNLACLLHKDKIQKLGNLLGEVNNREGFAVRFTGPWPPYSFVEKIKESK